MLANGSEPRGESSAEAFLRADVDADFAASTALWNLVSALLFSATALGGL
jgi:hypothetical protein